MAKWNDLIENLKALKETQKVFIVFIIHVIVFSGLLEKISIPKYIEQIHSYKGKKKTL